MEINLNVLISSHKPVIIVINLLCHAFSNFNCFKYLDWRNYSDERFTLQKSSTAEGDEINLSGQDKLYTET